MSEPDAVLINKYQRDSIKKSNHIKSESYLLTL